MKHRHLRGHRTTPDTLETQTHWGHKASCMPYGTWHLQLFFGISNYLQQSLTGDMLGQAMDTHVSSETSMGIVRGVTS